MAVAAVAAVAAAEPSVVFVQKFPLYFIYLLVLEDHASADGFADHGGIVRDPVPLI